MFQVSTQCINHTILAGYNINCGARVGQCSVRDRGHWVLESTGWKTGLKGALGVSTAGVVVSPGVQHTMASTVIVTSAC